MAFRSEDPNVDFTRYDLEQTSAMSQLRVCDECGKAIQDDYYFDIKGEILCQDCVERLYRRYND